MKIHNLKIEERFAYSKLTGDKPFEIRDNNREFEIGDLIKYKVVKNTEEKPLFTMHGTDDDPLVIENVLFQIHSVTDYKQKEGHVVFSDWPIDIVPKTVTWLR